MGNFGIAISILPFKNGCGNNAICFLSFSLFFDNFAPSGVFYICFCQRKISLCSNREKNSFPWQLQNELSVITYIFSTCSPTNKLNARWWYCNGLLWHQQGTRNTPTPYHWNRTTAPATWPTNLKCTALYISFLLAPLIFLFSMVWLSLFDDHFVNPK